MLKKGYSTCLSERRFPPRLGYAKASYLFEKSENTQSLSWLRKAVKEAWEKVGKQEFKELYQSMPARCQAITDADGLFTKYWGHFNNALVIEIHAKIIGNMC